MGIMCQSKIDQEEQDDVRRAINDKGKIIARIKEMQKAIKKLRNQT